MIRLTLLCCCLSLLLITTGCTSIIVERQGNLKIQAAARKQCPQVYPMTRLDMASLEWAIFDDNKPSDSCLAYYHPKAANDPFYAEVNAYMTPLYVLSLPVDVVVDTLTLPFALGSLDY